MLLFYLVAPCETTETSTQLIITNVTLIDGTGALPQYGMDVHIKDGKIWSIQKNGTNKYNSDTLDATGKYLIPGLIDGHVHPGNFKETFPIFMHYGVTTILVPGCSKCSDEHYSKMRQASAFLKIPAPRILHTSQHFSMKGRHPVKTFPSTNWVHEKTIFYLEDTLQIERYVKQVAQNPIIGIKVTIEDGPTPPMVPRIPTMFVKKIVHEASKYNLEVFAHVSDLDEVRIAIEGGVKNIIHFTGVDIDWDKDSGLMDTLLKQNISWVTTLMLDKSFLYPLNPAWLNFVEEQGVFDPVEITKLKGQLYVDRANQVVAFLKSEYQIEEAILDNLIQFQVDDLKMLSDKGCNVVIGTDTGNDFIFPGLSVHEEMQLMQLGGFKPLEVIKMATSNAAKMLKIENEVGSITEGKKADLILLDKNPLEDISNTLSINCVLKEGKIVGRINKNIRDD